MPGKRATLYIDGKEVSSNPESALRAAALTPEFNHYLLKRNPTWNPTILETIDWHLHSTSITRLKPSQQKTIRQFIHRWLPVNAHPGSSHAISPLCPLCNHHDETQHHFLSCTEIRLQEGWQLAATNIKKKANKLAIDPTLTRLLIQSILHWRTSINPPVPSYISHQYIPLFHQQTSLGWDQILQGRITHQWVHQQNRYAQYSKGQSQLSILFSTILTQVHTIWKIRCEAQHGTTQEDIQNKVKFQIGPRI
jgi:hypothetical protein